MVGGVSESIVVLEILGQNDDGVTKSEQCRCSEREPADSLRDKLNVTGSRFPPLIFKFNFQD
jgi:hypothetical protein